MTAAMIRTAEPRRRRGAVDGDRHGWLDDACHLFGRMISGLAAQEMLEDGRGSRPSALVDLPSWAWRVPAIDVGRKANADDGGRLRLPIRVVYEGGPLVACGPDGADVAWSAAGMGHAMSGTVRIIVSDLIHEPIVTLDEDSVPELVVAPSLLGPPARALSRVQRAGNEARFEVMAMLESFLRPIIAAEHAAISNEITQNRVSALLDPLALAQIQDELLLGHDKEKKKARAQSLIDRCLVPDRFANVDPLKYLTTSMHRDACQALQRHLGDPRNGPELRRLSRELGPEAPMSDIVAEYRRRRPDSTMDEAGLAERIADALRVGAIRHVSIGLLRDEEPGVYGDALRGALSSGSDMG